MAIFFRLRLPWFPVSVPKEIVLTFKTKPQLLQIKNIFMSANIVLIADALEQKMKSH